MNIIRHLSIFTLALCLLPSLAACQPKEQSEGNEATKTSGLPEDWKQIASLLYQANMEGLAPYMGAEAWGHILYPDVQYWTAYDIQNEVVKDGKGLLQVQFHELSKPVVLTFCHQNERWVFQGLYLRKAEDNGFEETLPSDWFFQSDWEAVLEKGFWVQYVECK